jgi:phosphoenolpyruvate carboxylase
VPKLYLALESRLVSGFGVAPRVALPPFLRLGSWIGGDRDGNPYVVAETLEYAIGAQARVAFEHYLDTIHTLGGELAPSTRLVQPTPQLLALAAAARDPNPHRADEPYRQALSGVYARVAGHRERARRLRAAAPAARRACAVRECGGASRRISRRSAVSLASHGATKLAEGPAHPADTRRRRVRIPSRGLDLRQNSDVHEQVVGELLAQAGVADDYRALDEDARVELLVRELSGRACCTRRISRIRERTASELAIMRVAADDPRRFGAAALPNYVISKCASVSTCSRSRSC